MASATLPTKPLRRALLTKSASAPLSPVMAGFPDTDAELLNWIALAEQRWANFVAAKEVKMGLFRRILCHSDCPKLPNLSVAERTKFNAIAGLIGYRDAADRCGDLHDLYGETMQTAFNIPAHTLRGLYAKLELAAGVARKGIDGAYTKTKFEWLDLAMADMERLASAAA